MYYKILTDNGSLIICEYIKNLRVSNFYLKNNFRDKNFEVSQEF